MIKNIINRIKDKIKWTKNMKRLTDKEKFIYLLKNLDKKVNFEITPDGIHIDPFVVDGGICDDFFISFYEDGTFQEFKIYLNQEEVANVYKTRKTNN